MRIWLCGALRIDVDGTRVEGRMARRKSRELAGLLADRDRAVPRDELVELLWPGQPPERRMGSLRQLLTELRQCLGPAALDGREAVRLVLPEGAWVDVRAAEEALMRARAARAEELWEDACAHAVLAADLLTAAFLDGDDAPWIDSRRQELDADAASALEELAIAALHVPGREHEAEHAARRLVARDPFRERGYALLMRALAARGDPAESLFVYERLRELLREELGTTPSEELRQMHTQVLALGAEPECGSSPPDPDTRYARRSDGVSVAYQVLGDGPIDLVLAPGLVSNLDLRWSDLRFRRWIGRLASCARLIMFDKAGTGVSGPLDHVPSLAERVEDVEVVMNAVGSRSATLLGLSESGATCIAFAAEYPERTDALILYGAFARAQPAPDYLWRHRKLILSYAEYVIGALQRWGQGDSIDVFAPELADSPIERRAWARLERATASPQGILQAGLAAWELDVRHLLGELTLPTLVIHRRFENATPVCHGRYLAQALPHARYLELEGVDHTPEFGDPDAVADAIEEFLATLVPRSVPRAAA